MFKHSYIKPQSSSIMLEVSSQLLSGSGIDIKINDQRTDASQLSDNKEWGSTNWDTEE